jgi:hypothetical protein
MSLYSNTQPTDHPEYVTETAFYEESFPKVVRHESTYVLTKNATIISLGLRLFFDDDEVRLFCSSAGTRDLGMDGPHILGSYHE